MKFKTQTATLGKVFIDPGLQIDDGTHVVLPAKQEQLRPVWVC